MGPTLVGVPSPFRNRPPRGFRPSLREPPSISSSIFSESLPGRALSGRRGKPSSKSSKLLGSPGRPFPLLFPAHFTPEPYRQGGLGVRRSHPQYSQNSSPSALSQCARGLLWTWPSPTACRGSTVEAETDEATAGDLVGILAGLAGHGGEQVVVGRGV